MCSVYSEREYQDHSNRYYGQLGGRIKVGRTKRRWLEAMENYLWGLEVKALRQKPNNEEELRFHVKEVRVLRRQCSQGVGTRKLNNSRGKKCCGYSNGSISRQTEYVHRFWHSLVLQKCNCMTWQYQQSHMLCKMCQSSFEVCSWAMSQIRFPSLCTLSSKSYVMHTELSQRNITAFSESLNKKTELLKFLHFWWHTTLKNSSLGRRWWKRRLMKL